MPAYNPKGYMKNLGKKAKPTKKKRGTKKKK